MCGEVSEYTCKYRAHLERKQFTIIFTTILILRKHVMVSTGSSNLNLETCTLIVIRFISVNNILKIKTGIGLVVDYND